LTNDFFLLLAASACVVYTGTKSKWVVIKNGQQEQESTSGRQFHF